MIQTVQSVAEEAFSEIQKEFPSIELASYKKKVTETLDTREGWTNEQVQQLLLHSAVERITSEEPDWTFVAARLYLQQLYKQAAITRGENTNRYGSFLNLIHLLLKEGIYNPQLITAYTEAEINELSTIIDPDKDHLFTYIGIVTLSERYLAHTLDKQPAELPQERWLIIAMTLMMNEPQAVRLQYVKEAYWALSNLYMTTATPTLANAGKSYGQLSSCFIDTVDDSLQGIFDANTDAANLSKNGGGLGIYLGKIRSQGSDIKGFKNVSSGVIPWMKQLNNTAVSVDQLGQRQGAIAVYLDVWHKDIFSFLETRLNNGDERRRTHDLFTGITIPDLFMEAVDNREEWHLFDPHEVRKVMGYSLEDSFDEKRGAGTFRNRYKECAAHPGLSKKTVPAIEIMKAIMISQLETGTPYMFYRDTVNRANPNKHAGMIYASNLCTEICQNMSPTVVIEEKTEDGKIMITKDPGDYVVCNLSSVSLARAVMDEVLERLIPIQVRMLDNVIEMNSIPVLQAQLTNKKYRGIGLGTFGWQHLLALKGLSWESDEAVSYCDELYEQLAFLTIEASAELAAEKGAYPVFAGSEWESGVYFEQRGYSGTKWQELKEKVKRSGMRNGYLLAVAPNSSTALIAGSTAGIDPVFRKEYMEEKKNYKIPVTAPDLSAKTTWYYKTVYLIDQHWSIRQNAKRQRHIDQAVSFNLYVRNDIKAKALLDLHLDAWDSGLKTTYYVRSTASDIEDCESCHS